MVTDKTDSFKLILTLYILNKQNKISYVYINGFKCVHWEKVFAKCKLKLRQSICCKSNKKYAGFGG